MPLKHIFLLKNFVNSKKCTNFAAEIKNARIMDTNNNALTALLQKSHAQAMAGNTIPSPKVSQLMHERVYELTGFMDACRVAEPV